MCIELQVHTSAGSSGEFAEQFYRTKVSFLRGTHRFRIDGDEQTFIPVEGMNVQIDSGCPFDIVIPYDWWNFFEFRVYEPVDTSVPVPGAVAEAIVGFCQLGLEQTVPTPKKLWDGCLPGELVARRFRACLLKPHQKPISRRVYNRIKSTLTNSFSSPCDSILLGLSCFLDSRICLHVKPRQVASGGIFSSDSNHCYTRLPSVSSVKDVYK